MNTQPFSQIQYLLLWELLCAFAIYCLLFWFCFSKIMWMVFSFQNCEYGSKQTNLIISCYWYPIMGRTSIFFHITNKKKQITLIILYRKTLTFSFVNIFIVCFSFPFFYQEIYLPSTTWPEHSNLLLCKHYLDIQLQSILKIHNRYPIHGLIHNIHITILTSFSLVWSHCFL